MLHSQAIRKKLESGCSESLADIPNFSDGTLGEVAASAPASILTSIPTPTPDNTPTITSRVLEQLQEVQEAVKILCTRTSSKDSTSTASW